MEISIRERLLQSFLEASHGKLDSLRIHHANALQHDPLFYAHLSRWYQQHGSLRDHHQLFPAHLFSSKDEEFRVHAKVLAQVLRPYQLARLVRYTKEKLRYSTRMLKSAVRFYLQRRENDPLWFDECVMRDKKSMKYLYTTLHLKPGERAQSILFKEIFPGDSRLAAVRELPRLANWPVRQAELIERYRIHYTTALGAIKYYTPEVVAALVQVMTPQQVVNNLKSLERRGALTSPLTRPTILEKIKKGTTESRVQDCKSFVVLNKIQNDAALHDTLLEMTQERLRGRGRIIVPTALFVDKSGSMDVCIDIGKRLATLVSTVMDAPLYVEAFDASSITVRAETPDLKGWERAFRHIRACGATSVGVSLRKLADTHLEQVVIVSDGEENTAPYFAAELEAYQKRHGRQLRIFLIQVTAQPVTPLEDSLRRSGALLTVIPFAGDYYNLPNVVPRLCSGLQYELVDEVLKMPLYTEDDLQTLPPGFDPVSCEIL